jgi:hypothetical protein
MAPDVLPKVLLSLLCKISSCYVQLVPARNLLNYSYSKYDESLFNPAGVGDRIFAIPRALPWILELKASGFLPFYNFLKCDKNLGTLSLFLKNTHLVG